MNDSSISGIRTTREMEGLRQLGLRGLIESSEGADGLDTRRLRVGDMLVVDTCNTRYVLQISDPARGAASATSDGKYITDPAEVALVGATLSGRGTMVKSGWVLEGFRLVLTIPGKELVTSPVRGVVLNGTTLFPAPRVH